MNAYDDLSAARQEISRLSKKVAALGAPSRDMTLLHPIAANAFQELAIDLQNQFEAGSTPTPFRAFEGYRSPSRQLALLQAVPPVTKARPWRSAHQYGLAVDFVPYVPSGGIYV